MQKALIERRIFIFIIIVMLLIGMSGTSVFANPGKPFTMTKKASPQSPEELVGDFDGFTDCINAMDINDLTSQYTIYVNYNTIMPTTDNSTERSSNKIRLTSGEGGPFTLKREGAKPLLHLNNNAVLEVDNLILDGCGEGSFTYLNRDNPRAEHSKLILGKGAVLQNFATDSYSMVYVQDGEVIVKDGAVIRNNEITDDRKSLFYIYENGEINIEGGDFENNSSNNFGGLIMSWGKVNIGGGTFTGNRSKYDGGAIAAYGGELNIYGGLFKGNAGKNGGTISCSNVRGIIKNAAFTENVAAGNGGAIYAKSGAKLSIENSTFSTNGSISQGSEIFYTQNGGALYVDKESSLDISGSTFTDNLSEAEGGAIYTESYTASHDGYATKQETGAYGNLKIDYETLFSGNSTNSGYSIPPENFSDFTNLGFSKTSFTGKEYSDKFNIEKSLLNNYDVNYQSARYMYIFDANGGKFNDDSIYYDELIGKDEEYTVLNNIPEKEGSRFLGWEEGGELYKVGDKLSPAERNRVFRAKWSKTSETPPDDTESPSTNPGDSGGNIMPPDNPGNTDINPGTAVKPEIPKDAVGPQQTTKTNTGDDSNIYLYLGIGIVALLAIFLIIKNNKPRN